MTKRIDQEIKLIRAIGRCGLKPSALLRVLAFIAGRYSRGCEDSLYMAATASARIEEIEADSAGGK